MPRNTRRRIAPRDRASRSPLPGPGRGDGGEGVPAPQRQLVPRRYILPVAVGLAALALYLLTISPTISTAVGSADSGELVSVASVLGVAHPPGYGLYMLLSRAALEAFRFLDEPALRTNVLSALCTAGAAAVVVLVIRRWSPATPTWAAAVGALAFATAPAVWSQAIVTEVYALHALLVALALLAALAAFEGARWEWLGLALGALVAHHPTGWLVALPLAAVALVALRPHPAEVARGVAAATIFPLVGAAYLVLRAGAPIAWGDTATPGGLYHQLSGADYRGLWEWSPAAFASALPGSVRMALVQVPPPLWPVLPAGALAAWRTRPPLAAALGVTSLVLVLFVTVYRAEGREPYLIPIALAGGLVSALGLVEVWRWFVAWAARAGGEAIWTPRALAGVLALGLVLWTVRTGADLSLRGNHEAEREARALLAAAPPDSTVRVNRDEVTFPLWYLHTVRGVRPDAAIEDVRGIAPLVPRRSR